MVIVESLHDFREEEIPDSEREDDREHRSRRMDKVEDFLAERRKWYKESDRQGERGETSEYETRTRSKEKPSARSERVEENEFRHDRKEKPARLEHTGR